MKLNRVFMGALAGLVLLSGVSVAAADKPRSIRGRTEVIRELTPKGQELEAHYADRLSTLKKEITAALPDISDAEKAALLEAFNAEVEPEKKVNSAWAKVVKFQRRAAEDKLEALRHQTQYTSDTIDTAEARLKWAKSLPDDNPNKEKEIKSAKHKIGLRTKEVESLPGDIKKAEKQAVQAREKLPQAMEQYKKAAAALDERQARTRKIVDQLGLGRILDGSLDTKLIRAVILEEATPRRLAEFAQQGPEKEEIVSLFLSDLRYAKRMLLAGGPLWGKYGQAMEIYTDIRKASDRAKDGVLERLALATAVENAVPWRLGDPEAVDGPEYVDPVERYLSYEKAYLEGELDPSFADQSVWALRMVVTTVTPGEAKAWGRQLLRNYLPDLMRYSLEDQRYVALTRAVRYGSDKVDQDRAELHEMQNILDNGGICGRRAKFGRFILRAFGVPATARPQPGHAALAHFAPDEWQTYNGAGWGANNHSLRGKFLSDLDFLATTRARRNMEEYPRVERAHWIGTLMGEEPTPSRLSDGEKRFWHAISLVERQRIIDAMDFPANTPGDPSMDGRYRERLNQVSQQLQPEELASLWDDSKITRTDEGVITIPVVKTTEPASQMKVIFHGKLQDGRTFMKSHDGGLQVHFSRRAFAGADLHYTFQAPRAGKYALTAKVVTPGHQRPLNVDVNDSGKSVPMPLPYTAGKWETTEPLIVELKRGTNTLYMSGPTRASFKQFQLTPVN